MSAETSQLKPTAVAVASEAKPQHIVLSAPTTIDQSPQPAELAATNVDKPQPTGQNAAILAALDTDAADIDSLLADLTSPNSIHRASAASALGRLADTAAVPALITALNDHDADVAREAAASLGNLASFAAVDPLIAVLNNRDGYFHTVVRIAAATSLGQLRDPRAVIPLLNSIRDEVAEVSAESIRALASIPDPRALPALLDVVRNENNFFIPPTRRAAILGLGHVGGPQSECELKFVAANQWEDATVRAAAMEAMPKSPVSPTAAQASKN